MNWEAVGDLSGTTATVDIELAIGYRRTYYWGAEKLESVRTFCPHMPYVCYFPWTTSRANLTLIFLRVARRLAVAAG